ncbi:hypothetical protein F5884DRAFT_225652 [Xylogone sp. PMI_703]|nr:hypothetical protein F5884DRAFT_225652 [Xylogone sp. PMI_703]
MNRHEEDSSRSPSPPLLSKDELRARVLPQMILSDGSEGSNTGPPAPPPHYISSAGRARLRFEVEGNAIVTGGLGALGLECSRALLEHGLSGLVIFDRDTEQAQATVADLKKSFSSRTIIFKEVDVTDEIAVGQAVAEAGRELGSIDILLCFAGIVSCGHALDLSAAEFRRTIDVNTTGSFLCAQAVARLMVEQDTGGSIIFTASISGHRVNYPQPQVAYNVSKSAVLMMKNSLAAEWARYGIRVNSVSPGYMDTVLNEGAGLAQARAIWASRTPFGRMGQPTELTGAVVLLASSAGSYITGTDIILDGGITLF